MSAAAGAAQNLTAVAFVALGAAIAYRWYRERRTPQRMLALALISLGVVAALGRLGSSHPSAVISVVTVVGLMLSAYFVLLFRNEFVPLGPRFRLAANLLLAVSIVVGVADVLFAARAPFPITTLLGLELVVTWGILTGEPVVRFWLASNQLPGVQRSRMRYLSFGFAILIAILFVAVLGGRALQSSTAILVTQLVALASVPIIYVSFAPPSLLRRIWRMSEEAELRAAMQDLLIFSPTREVLADRAAFWAMRLVGSNAAFIVDGRRNVIASSGIDRAHAAALAATDDKSGGTSAGTVLKAPLHLSEGKGYIAVVPGRFTPVFGSDEISQLNAFANSVAAGLERVRVTERMATIENNKSQFLNLASHELRGPITVLRGYASMLEAGMLGQLNERGKKAAEVMAAKVSEMNELIEEMIDAARLEDGGVTLRLVESDLRDIAQAAAEAIAPMVDASHRLVLDLPERRVRVNVDPERTRTILANLMSNGVKYSPNGGQVTCQVRSRGGIVRATVSDEGLGIAPADMSKLFTRFGRVITPETEHLKGTGLGLFLSRQLARLQGGEITVTSVPGKGSTFTLQLPTGVTTEPVPPHEEGGATTARPSSELGERRVRATTHR